MTKSICSSLRPTTAGGRLFHTVACSGIIVVAASTLMITHAAAKPVTAKKPAAAKSAVKPTAKPAAGVKLPASVVEKTDLKAFTQEIPGTKVSFTMLPIPGGTMTMVDPANPGKTVTVTIKPFYLEKTETRWDEFLTYSLQRNKPNATPGTADAVSKPSTTYIPPDKGYGKINYPAISIAYNNAETYCKWLSIVTGKKYRLPTEAEWEWAARAGSNNVAPLNAAELEKQAWFKGNANRTTHPVMKKAPNAWGLYDMFGNAAEWCQGPTGAQPARGGSFRDDAGKVGAAARSTYTLKWQEEDPQFPKSKWWLSNADFAGLRIVCDPE